ncbi:GGDEF domain-containing protein [Rhodanobacter sp. AS-Z3]|uniref:tetratricopeptide repeat-containing diguanylate cyclase n=1 Tax=Rhodanobacter sp. AS-Z3 TaxID=3031330 RepID=UPI00247A51E1|nr:GGDEF domain-containing protein [Rhodanobacter sp. AS-Z3]WEN14195.1 GGDEF domain-containing protein [Rhodanobacter sp. AS-Z3]
MRAFSALRRLALIAACGGGLPFAVSTGVAASTNAVDAASLLQQAEHPACTTSLSDQCVSLLRQLEPRIDELAPEQQQHLRYLQAWQAILAGDYKKSDALTHAILSDSQDDDLRLKTRMLQVNSLSEQSRFEDAFRQLDQLVGAIGEGSRATPSLREKGYGVVSSLYADAGQYALASYYAEQIFTQGLARPGFTCVDDHARIAARFGGRQWNGIEPLISEGVATCLKENNSLYANGIRYFAASLALQQGDSDKAIALLSKHLAEVHRDNYSQQVAQFEGLLAQAYQQAGKTPLARQFALAAVGHGTSNRFAPAVVEAYKILYTLAKQEGDAASALAYHEKYMVADKGHLDEVSAKALAFQTVKQQLAANKAQVDTLSRQNQVLKLQQALDRKASETSRLQLLLLLLVLGFIAFMTYRIKRSQLRFMKLARRDGLTGIFNRQHFVTSAEQQLQYCRKSSRQACLVLIDLDHFKVVNDTHGHAVGDRVLKRAVAACEQHLRSTDIFGRLGGEEFGILLPECTLEQALARAEQIREAIAAASVFGDNLAEVPVSASFGVATIERSGYDLRKLLVDADDGLYRAKREGRNRVMVSDDTQPRQRVAGVAVDHG